MIRISLSYFGEQYQKDGVDMPESFAHLYELKDWASRRNYRFEYTQKAQRAENGVYLYLDKKQGFVAHDVAVLFEWVDNS